MTTPSLHAAARATWLATWRAVMEDARAWAALEAVQLQARGSTCRVCGCTDDAACLLRVRDPLGREAELACWWVEPGLCSGCAR